MRTLLFLVCLGAPAAAVDFVDTRLVFVAGDDDFSHDAGTTVPPSQQADLGDRVGYTEFYDRRTESETQRFGRTHLVLHTQADGYFERVFTEAAMVIQLDHARILSGDPRALKDDGTYLNIEYRAEAGTLAAVLMPFESDRLRLGGLWDVTWGGSHSFPGGEATPAMKLEWRAPWWDVFATLKTARMTFQSPDPSLNGQVEAVHAIYGGIGAGKRDDGIRVELQAGFINKGTNTRDAVLGEPVDAGGVTGRIAYVDGLPFEATNDTRFYSADPVKPFNSGRGRSGWRVAAEATFLSQTLEDPERTGGVDSNEATAAAIYGRGEGGGHRVFGRFIYRDVSFLMFDAPGPLSPFQLLPDGIEETPEWVATFGYEKHFGALHFTPGLTLGVQQPASLSNTVPPAGLYPIEGQTGRRTLVLRRADMFDDAGFHTLTILPKDEDALPLIGARVHGQLDLAEGFALLAELTVLHDSNRVLFVQDVLGVNDLREFDTPTTFGAALMAIAEF